MNNSNTAKNLIPQTLPEIIEYCNVRLRDMEIALENYRKDRAALTRALAELSESMPTADLPDPDKIPTVVE